MTYKLCIALLSKGKLTSDKVDVYFAAGRITAEQYAELIAKLNE